MRDILNLLFKDFSVKHTVTSLAKEIGMTRVGIWKALKKLEAEKYVILTPVGKGKTSAYIIKLNWGNPILEKNISMLLAEESQKNQRWLSNFSGLEKQVEFLIIYGSILNNPNKANDIDIISVVPAKEAFVELEKTIDNIQKTQFRKVHAINFNEREFRSELEKPNVAFIDALKRGIVLFGQEKFIKFIRDIAAQ